MTGDEKDASLESVGFRWSVRPYEEAPGRRIAIFCIAFMGGAGGWFLLREPLLGLVGFGMILASTMEYWMGTTYQINSKGASSRTGISLTMIEWQDVKRLIPEDHGIKLSPLEKSGRLDVFRGVFLKFSGENREQVLQALRTFGGENVRSLEG